MRTGLLRVIAVTAVLLAAAAPGSGSNAPARGSAPLRLLASPPTLVAAPGGAGVIPTIEGFGLSSRPGEPALPLRILLVAIPEGSQPELRIVRAVPSPLPRLDVAPVPRLRVRDRSAARPRSDHDYRRDRRLYDRDARYPEAPVRLGRIGRLRAQRFVEVIFTPVLHNPALQEGQFYPEVEAEVLFDLPADLAASPHFLPEPTYEETYAASLVNYEQGRLFRAAAPAPESLLDVPAARPEAGAALLDVPAGPRFKLLVSQPGVYRLSHAFLTAQAPPMAAADPRTLYLLVNGVEVPLAVRDAAGGSGESDGVFNTGDVLEFYGRPPADSPTVLNFDFTSTLPDIYGISDFTDTQVYWLQAGGSPGSHVRIPAVAGAPVSGFPQVADFEAAAIWEENQIFIPVGPAEPFFSLPSMLAGAVPQRDLSIALPGLAATGPSAALTVRLRGGSDTIQDPDHRTRAWVNSNLTDVADFTWNGERIREEVLSVPHSTLTNPATVHVQAPGLAGVSVDRQYVDSLTVRYRRTFTAAGETLTFKVPNQNTRFQVGGLTAASPVVYEIGRINLASGEPETTSIAGAVPGGAPTSNWTFEIPEDMSPGAPAERTFVVAGPAAYRLPDAVAVAQEPALVTAGNSADLLVIAARTVVDATPGGALDLLLQHRLAAQGLTSRVVYMDQVYDEFSFGRRDANAVREFFAYAYANWRGPGGLEAPPSFAILVGDGTLDYKNTLNRGDWVDQTPTPILLQENNIIGYYSSDNYLASFLGTDQIPDIHLGRITARSMAESAGVFTKIRQYETTPPAGGWKGRAILTAGDGKVAGEAESFQAIDDTLRADYFSTAPFSSPLPPLYFAQPPWNSTDAAGFQAALTAELQAGASVLTFVGHGSFDTWGLTTIFSTAAAQALTNGLRLPFMLNINCLSGGFHYLLPGGSVAEGMVNNPSGGGVAAFAPSGLSNAFVGSVVADELFLPLLGPAREQALGVATDPVRVALWSRGSIVDLQSYTLLGDPATRLAVPAPPPPVALAAAAGNGQVTLSWTSPGGPAAMTRIYRAAGNPSSAYAAVTCTPLTATSCADATVQNATRYYYYAVSVDGEGYEGAASNFNGDCDAGPDCVTALPLNPGPPAVPAGLQVGDPGTGGRLNVAWQPNSETDLKRYTVYYGVQPGVYGASVNVTPPTASLVIFGLTDGVRYYVTVRATNTSDNQSGPAPEQSAVPHLFEGLAPPRAIDDLALALSGDDLLLSWSRPLVDIYGRPTTVTGYKIHRGTTPGYQPGAGNLLTTIGSGATTSYTHTGGASLAGESYYVVTATDAVGLTSGAGRDLPNGIGNLDVTFQAPSTVHLAWTPVTTDVQGLPTLLDHYQIHVTSVPAGRGSLGPATLFMDNVTATSLDLSLPASPGFISVLAVDNRGNLSPF